MAGVSQRRTETRERTKNKVTWTPPSKLDVPPAPDGYKFRWLRRTKPGESHDDVQNLLAREKQEYIVVTADKLRELGGEPESYQTLDSGRHAGAVINGDLILALVPEEIADARREYYEQRSALQMEAVRRQLDANQNPVMPITNSSKTNVKIGRHSFED